MYNKPLFTIVCTLSDERSVFHVDMIKHIVDQTELDFECLLVSCIKDKINIEINDKRFKKYFCDSTSLGEKRNVGLLNATGKYICFCDDDDYYDVNFFKTMKKICIEHEPELIVSLMTRNEIDLASQKSNNEGILIDEKSKIEAIYYGRFCNNDNNSYNDKYNLNSVCGKAFYRQFLIDNNCYFINEPVRSEDLLFTNSLVVYLSKIFFFSDYYGYYWRVNPSSATRSINSYFYNIEPFYSIFANQLINASILKKEDIYNYLTIHVFSIINNVFLLYCSKGINKKTLIKKIESTIGRRTQKYMYLYRYNSNLRKRDRYVLFCLKFKAYGLASFFYKKDMGKLLLQRLLQKSGLMQKKF